MSLIEDFVAATNNGLSPERFRRWTALSMISTALDRRVWTSIVRGKALYPNLYVLLVGPPGVGKSTAISPARRCLETQPHIALSPNSITHEAFIKLLSERAKELDMVNGEPKQRATLGLFLSEWGTFLRRPENDDLSMLADIYDCENFERLTIGRWDDPEKARNLYVNILAACTPAWFAEGFPPNSYEQGLPTRFQFIYSTGQDVKPDFEFTEEARNTSIADKFLPKLDKLTKYAGFVQWSAAAGKAFNKWKQGGFEPRPRDPLLVGYCERRHLHVAKMSILFAAARGPKTLEITKVDFDAARAMLLEAEPDMSIALEAAGGNPYQLRQEAVANFVTARFRETKRDVPEWEVRQRLGKMVPPNILRSLLDELIASKKIKQVYDEDRAPNRRLRPGVRK